MELIKNGDNENIMYRTYSFEEAKEKLCKFTEKGRCFFLEKNHRVCVENSKMCAKITKKSYEQYAEYVKFRNKISFGIEGE